MKIGSLIKWGNIINKKSKDAQAIENLRKQLQPGDIEFGFDMENSGRPVILHLKDRLLHMQIFGPTGSGKTSMILLPMVYSDFMTQHFTYNDDVEVPQLGQITIDPKGDFAEQVWALGKINEIPKRKNYLRTIVDENLKIQMAVKNKTNESKSLLNEAAKRHLSFIETDRLKVLSIELKNLKDAFKVISPYMNKAFLMKQTTFALFVLAGAMCKVVTMPQYRSDFVPHQGKAAIDMDNLPDRDQVLYFNPVSSTCPYFNPLAGDERDTIAGIVDTFKSFQTNSSQYFVTLGGDLLTRGIKVVKRLYGQDANFLKLNDLLFNSNNRGLEMINQFRGLEVPTQNMKEENAEIADWFTTDYLYQDNNGNPSKTFLDSSNIRSQLSKLLQNRYLRKVLNPPIGIGNQMDFDSLLENGDEVAISTARGELGSELSTYLGQFIIQQIQAAIFRRRGLAEHRIPCMLTIDEFQEFANDGFAGILTMGRSYGVAAHLATQTRGSILQKSDPGFMETVDANCRNIITFPGINPDDAEHFSEVFGQIRDIDVQKSHSAVDLSPLQKVIHPELDRPATESVKAAENIHEIYDSTQLQMGADFYEVREAIERERDEGVNLEDQIQYNTFGHVFFRLMNHGSIGLVGYSQVRFVDRSVKQKIDLVVENYETLNHSDDMDSQLKEIIQQKNVDDIKAPKQTDVISGDDSSEDISEKMGISSKDSDDPTQKNASDNVSMENDLESELNDHDPADLSNEPSNDKKEDSSNEDSSNEEDELF